MDLIVKGREGYRNRQDVGSVLAKSLKDNEMVLAALSVDEKVPFSALLVPLLLLRL